ncbi:MAG: hypothetical protein ACLS63_06680 [Flavonifractor plautii]
MEYYHNPGKALEIEVAGNGTSVMAFGRTLWRWGGLSGPCRYVVPVIARDWVAVRKRWLPCARNG